MNRRIFLITSSAKSRDAQEKNIPGNAAVGMPDFFAIRIERVLENTFKSRMNNNLVHISWQTASEQDSSHFELQRSSNGRDFDLIETIMAVGNSNSVSRYSTTDSKYSFFNDRLYYRLKVVSKSGSISFTDEVSMDLSRFGASVYGFAHSRNLQ